MYTSFKKAKGIKKIIRYGSLNSRLRPKYWKAISDQENIVRKVREIADMKDEGNDDSVTKFYSELMEKIPEDETRLTYKIRDEISKDLARTRTSEHIKTEEG